MTGVFAGSSISFLDMAAAQQQFGANMMAALKPVFADLGLLLDSFVVENISLPEELQKLLDQRIGMNMVGDMGRYTQFSRWRNRRLSRPLMKEVALPAREWAWALAHSHGAADDGLHAAARAARSTARRCRTARGRTCRRRGHQVLHELRQAHSTRGAFLFRVRRRAAITRPHVV